MAKYNGNGILVKINSIDVSAYYTEINFEPSNSPAEVTAGAGTAHVQRLAGLNDTKLSLSLEYRTTTEQSVYIASMTPGSVYQIEFGPEGGTAGKPKHVQSFILESAPIKIGVKKDQIIWSLSYSGSDAPSINMLSGSVY